MNGTTPDQSAHPCPLRLAGAALATLLVQPGCTDRIAGTAQGPPAIARAVDGAPAHLDVPGTDRISWRSDEIALLNEGRTPVSEVADHEPEQPPTVGPPRMDSDACAAAGAPCAGVIDDPSDPPATNVPTPDAPPPIDSDAYVLSMDASP